MNELGIIITALLGIFFLLLPRRLAVVPLLIATCYLTLGQEIVVFSLHFTSLRILVLVGWARILIREEIAFIKLNVIDKLIIGWTISGVVIFSILYQSSAAFVNRLGMAYNYLGLYIIFRSLIHNLEEFNKLLKIFAIILIPLAVFMALERATGRNVFSVFGGVPELSDIRYGKIRSQGSSSSPILAGTIGATMLPLISSLWWHKGGKRIGFLGIIACTIIIITSASSGPLMASLIGIASFAAWRYRSYTKQIRRGIVVILILLHFVIMNAPVWYIFDRVAGFTGGTGWYRSELIEQAIKHFDDWWLMGTKDTASWMPFALEDAFAGFKADITNQFIAEGVNGGLLTLALFVLVIVYCFKAIGFLLKVYASDPFTTKITIWAMGAALVAHLISFFSVSYFDQVIVFWFFLLASISTLSVSSYKKHEEIV